VVHAEAIIENGVQNFMQWKETRQQVPLIKALSGELEVIQAQEVLAAQRRLARGDSPDAVLQGLAHALSQKLLHGAYAGLSSPDVQAREEAATVVRRLFKISDSL